MRSLMVGRNEMSVPETSEGCTEQARDDERSVRARSVWSSCKQKVV